MKIKSGDGRISVPTLLFDPKVYVFDFVRKPAVTKFLRVDESQLAESPFIDIRFEPLARGQFTVNTRDVFRYERSHLQKRPQPMFIFHHAFVCSTLLARCLNQADAFFSLKEPWIYRRLADFKRSRGQTLPAKQWREMFVTYSRLLARRYGVADTPVIKATNVANNLINDVLHFLPDSKVLYLYSDLQSFLVSNLKKNIETQRKMPDLALGFLADSDFPQKFPQMCDLGRLSFLQVCALIWLLNLYQFKRALEVEGAAQVRTLDAAVLLADLPGQLGALSKHFSHTPSPDDIRRMIDPGVLRTNAKDQLLSFGTDQRAREAELVLSRHGQEIKQALAWINPLVADLDMLGFMRTLALSAAVT